MASGITKFAHLQIPLEDIVKATNNFADENIIGRGGFGYGYKGRLLQSGKLKNVSVRRLDRKYGEGDVEFWTEISMLSDLKHENIVSIIGYCDEKDEKIIIYTDEANGSLEKHLNNINLTWMQRLRICVGVARALSYLHYDEGRGYSVIHRNINSYTILLDENWEAKLSGFEISLKQPVSRMDQILLSEAIGTVGYMDPTIEETGGVTHKSDIFSFGVVLFEILCGRNAFIPNEADRYLAPLAKCHYENDMLQDIIHPDLWKQMDLRSRSKFSEVAYSCLKKKRVQRPVIDQVVNKLETALQFHLQLGKNLEQLEKIPLRDIKLVTDDFSDTYCISFPGYYKLYIAQLDHFHEEYCNFEGKNKDELPKRQTSVAIKRILPGYKLKEYAFWKEIKMLTTCKHHNIVTPLGYCDEGSERIMVIENLSNGYLGDYMRNIRDMHILSWEKRLKICLDVAKGLKYLHSEMEDQKTIINCDIRSDYIALVENWRAKIADFGLSIILPRNQDGDAILHTRNVCGTPSYIDPEYQKTGKLKRASDVYSFGVVLFEILCGRLAFDPIYLRLSDKGLASVARRCFQEGTLKEMIDPKIKDEIGENHSLDIYVNIAYKCVADTQDERPTMEVIIKELENALFFQGKNLKHLKKIPLSDIKLATDNFSDTHCIWFPGYYKLYRAQLDHFDTDKLPNRHNIVAIKRILPGYKLKREAFLTEIEMLITCKHHNIVTLLGFCDEDSECILVIEHLSNGYLGDYLRNRKDMPVLNWEKRLKICLDVAKGLSYLHSEMEDQKMIINRDIRSDYIALDENWRAKITDFGLSVFLPQNLDSDALFHDGQQILGSKPYSDPEYAKSGKLKTESDVYNFGVVLCEILCGRSAYDPIYVREGGQGLAHVVRRYFRKGKLYELIDPIIKKENGENNFVLDSGRNKHSLDAYFKIASKCLAQTQDQRPSMAVVIKELEKALIFQGKKMEHLKKIPLSDIKLATDNFSDNYSIWCPGYYKLYRAQLDHFDKEICYSVEGENIDKQPKRHNVVAIKRILPGYKLKREVFLKEIEMLTTCKHHNIVTLLGFCDEDSESILVIEHLSNGYLGDYLKNIIDRPILNWEKRLKICLDVAKGLNYLHSDMDDQKTVINRDIRSDYIALDENWRAKVTDFGISVFVSPNQDGDVVLHDRKQISGSDPYIDPEYARTGKLRRESDVYSFGVVLFEVLFGRSACDPIYLKEGGQGLVREARRCSHKGKLHELIDPVIIEENGEHNFVLNIGPDKDSLDAYLKIASECLAQTQVQRPTMKVIIEEIEKAITFEEKKKDSFRISLEDINVVTQNFHPDNCIGGGGFGKVFTGKVPKGDAFDTIVAKRLDTSLGQGEQQFLSELHILHEYKHENIIRLLGYCDEKDDKILVYEYACKGSLDRYLNDNCLTWAKRLQICVDVATALDFLHGGTGTQAKVIHRDIKSANILLNEDWKAKIADFGLSLISPIYQETDYVIDHVCGTPGYLDPVYRKSGFLTIESDIYSFGVVLFEILCGRSTFEICKHEGRFIPSFINHMFGEGKQTEVVFEGIKEQIKPESLTTFERIAFQCLEIDREKRPTAKEVLAQLKVAMKLQED